MYKSWKQHMKILSVFLWVGRLSDSFSPFIYFFELSKFFMKVFLNL